MHYVISRYLTLRSLVLLVLDVAVLSWGTALAVYLRLGHTPAYTFSADGFGYAVAVVVLVHMVAMYYHELYALRGSVGVRSLGANVAQSVAISSALLWVLYYMVPEIAIGRGIFLINMLLLPPLLTGSRMIYLWMGNRQALQQRVVVIGEPDQVREVVRRLSGEQAYQLVGVLLSGPPVTREADPDDSSWQIQDAEAENAHAETDFNDPLDPDHPPNTLGVPVLGPMDSLRELSERHRVDGVIVAMRERRGRLPLEDLLYLKLLGVQVEQQAAFLERATGRVPVDGLPPSDLVFAEGFRRIHLYQRLKIAPDAIAAALGLLVLAIPLAFVALLVKWDSPGPALYRQVRVGRAGQAFKINKFRTMRTDAEQSGAQFAAEEDPRVTRLGRFLRKSRIDELPQLYNVLVGEMSFVGPRPERPEFVADLQQQIPYYYLRTVVRPGITGWAQVRYPYGATLRQHREKLEHDLYYIKNVSFIMDTLIALETMRVMLFARGSR